MTPEKQIEEIWSVLRAMTVRENEIEKRFNERMDRAEAKSTREHEKAMKRMDRHEEKMRLAQEKADERMVKFDQRLEATRKLVEGGMKLVMEMRRQQIADRAEVRRMQKNWDAYFASLRHPRNGNSRH